MDIKLTVTTIVVAAVLALFAAKSLAQNPQQTKHFITTGSTDKINLAQLQAAIDSLAPRGKLHFVIAKSEGGGYFHGLQVLDLLIKAKTEKDIKVVFHTHSYCYSMCALLLSEDSRRYPSVKGKFLFHTLQSCNVITDKCIPILRGNVRARYIQRWGKYFRTVLTTRQYKGLLEGVDITITADQLNRGIQQWNR